MTRELYDARETFTHLHIWKSASAFGTGEFVGRAQIGCRSMAELVADRLKASGYVVDVDYNMEALKREADECMRVMDTIESVMKDS